MADIEILGELKRLPVICACRENEIERRKEIDAVRDSRRRLERFKRYSLTDNKFQSSTFANWKFRADNRRLYEIGERYCEKWAWAKKGNKGMLLRGIAGCGKTYLAFCIANELYKRGQSVLATSASMLARIIQDGYNKRDEGATETDVLEAVSDVSLLILDDLGAENKTRWAYEKLYGVIDARYRAGKPLIITTNLDDDAFAYNLSVIDIKSGEIDKSKRIYSRISEMCSTVEVTGASWREQKESRNTLEFTRELLDENKPSGTP